MTELLKHTVPVTAYYPGTKDTKVMIKAKLRGTTFTGHPTSTTFGNTWRMFFYSKYIAKKEGLKVKLANAGDDVVAIFSRQDQIKFFRNLHKYVRLDPPKNPESYGLGQLFRELNTSTTKFEFLSRDGIALNGQVYMSRKIERILQGSHVTKSVPMGTMKPEQYHQAVTIGL